MIMSRDESRLLSPGEIIKDTYVVDRFLGSGAFAEVYRVTHKYLGMQAMKVLKPHAVKDEGLKLFLSEATILTNITAYLRAILQCAMVYSRHIHWKSYTN